MPYLPTEPLIPVLQTVIDTRLLGRGGYQSGIQGFSHHLADITGYRVKSQERQIVRILRGEVHFIRESTADAIATALGRHPQQIWCDWFDITTPKSWQEAWACLGRRLILSYGWKW